MYTLPLSTEGAPLVVYIEYMGAPTSTSSYLHAWRDIQSSKRCTDMCVIYSTPSVQMSQFIDERGTYKENRGVARSKNFIIIAVKLTYHCSDRQLLVNSRRTQPTREKIKNTGTCQLLSTKFIFLLKKKLGQSGSRTRDLSHPKRESCH